MYSSLYSGRALHALSRYLLIFIWWVAAFWLWQVLQSSWEKKTAFNDCIYTQQQRMFDVLCQLWWRCNKFVPDFDVWWIGLMVEVFLLYDALLCFVMIIKCQPGSEGVRLDLAPKNMIKLLKTLYYRYITDDFFFHHASINFIMKILVITRYISTFMASVPRPAIVQGNHSLLYNYLRYDDKFQSMSYHLNWFSKTETYILTSWYSHPSPWEFLFRL